MPGTDPAIKINSLLASLEKKRERQARTLQETENQIAGLQNLQAEIDKGNIEVGPKGRNK